MAINERMLVIERILKNYIRIYKRIYCGAREVDGFDFRKLLENEYNNMLRNGFDEYKTVNLYFVKRALNACQLYDAVHGINLIVKNNPDFSEEGYQKAAQYFVYNNPNFRDIMQEYAFNRFFKLKAKKIPEDQKVLLLEYI